MEPICWAGLVGIVAIAAAIGGLLKGSCKNSVSSCGCGSKQETPVAKDPNVDEKKEKAIDDLIK
jgi:hypothetical protein